MKYLVFVVTLFTMTGYLEKKENLTRKLKASTEPLVNPGKGWVIYGPDVSSYPQTEWLKLCPTKPFRDIPREVWNIGSVVYMRYHWSNLEPKEGIFNWKILDNPIRLAQEQGKQFAFGVMSCNSCLSTQAIPQFVFDAEAKLVNKPEIT